MLPLLPIVASFVLLILAVCVVLVYNALVVLRNNINAAYADIDVLLKKRHDLIGELIDVVKGYKNYEKTLLTSITSLRIQWSQNSDASLDQRMGTSNKISAALKSIFAVSENYPDLKADQNFLQLQKTITEVEDQIADRREFYNDSVNAFNTRIEQIPYDFFAKVLGYSKLQFLQTSEAEKKNVKVSSDV